MPRLLGVRLDGFSLYASKKKIKVSFSRGAFCLAGANGIGKSTFLAAVNYGLTGIVPDPGRKFESVSEHYDYSLGFAEEFFQGRIEEGDRGRAQVSLDFEIGDKVFKLTRGVFERERLRAILVWNKNTDEIELDGRGVTPSQRQNRFADLLSAEVGLESFRQFVFLQHFVFTFDERRHLLFWDHRVLEQALYLCFGLDPKDADKADSLSREAERADSLVRNLQWQATQLQKKVHQLESVVDSDDSGDDLEETLKQHRKLTTERDTAEDLVRRAEAQRQDADVLFAKATAEAATLSGEYEAAFADYLQSHVSPSTHPLVKASIKSQICNLCGATGIDVVEAIKKRLSSELCPLCETKVAMRARMTCPPKTSPTKM